MCNLSGSGAVGSNGDPLAILLRPNISKKVVAAKNGIAVPALLSLSHCHNCCVAEEAHLDVIELQRLMRSVLYVVKRISF
jgi:hypothetical protein